MCCTTLLRTLFKCVYIYESFKNHVVRVQHFWHWYILAFNLSLYYRMKCKSLKGNGLSYNLYWDIFAKYRLHTLLSYAQIFIRQRRQNPILNTCNPTFTKNHILVRQSIKPLISWVYFYRLFRKNKNKNCNYLIYSAALNPYISISVWKMNDLRNWSCQFTKNKSILFETSTFSFLKQEKLR